MSTVESEHTVSARRPAPRYALYLLVAGMLLIAGWLAFKTWRLLQLAQSLQSYQAQAESLTANGLMNADPDQAEALMMNLRRDVVAVDNELRPFLPLATRLGWLPRVGPMLAHSEALLDLADAGTEAGAYAIRGLKPALALVQDESQAGESLLAQLMPVVQDAEGDLLAASAALDHAMAARQSIESLEGFPWRIRSVIETIDGKLYLADELRLLTVLPEIMGAEGRREYLIFAQNEDEIRPTGGFLTGAGVLVVEGGQIVDLEFQDGNSIDDWQNKPYDAPPDPLVELMDLQLFFFRDANFWADFPTSAEKAIELYTYGQDNAPQFDGVIAIDQQFVAMLLAVTGPVEVPQLEATVNRNNVIASLRDAWAAGEGEEHRDWLRERKEFLGPLAQALRARLLGDFGALDPLYLAETIHQAAEQKRLQIYARDAQVAAVLQEIGWDGQQTVPTSGDYLMVVDTNVGYNKVNALVSSAIVYHVDLEADGTGMAALDVSYEHHGEASAASCEQIIPYAEGITYQVLIDQCYWNYLRIYVPAGATPLEMDQHPIGEQVVPVTDTWREPSDGQLIAEGEPSSVIANRFVLPRGGQLTTHYAYRLPAVVESGEHSVYRLVVQKQAGTGAQPLEVQITVPPGATVLDTSPAGQSNGRQVTFVMELNSDQIFEVSYGAP